MKHQHQKVILTLVLMTFVSILLYVHKRHNLYSLRSILRPREGLRVPIDSKVFPDIEDTLPGAITNGCDNDKIFENKLGHNWTERIKQKHDYLENRRLCILKHCGEVCDTTMDFQDGKTYN